MSREKHYKNVIAKTKGIINMKKYSYILIFLLILMACIPLSANKNIMRDIFCGKTPDTAEVFADSIQTGSYTIPDNITFTDTSANTLCTRSTKSLIYSMTGALVDNDFFEQEVKAFAVACQTRICYEYENGTFSINTKDSTVFLNENELKNKFGSDVTLFRSYCDNVYNNIITQNGKPCNLFAESSDIQQQTVSAADPFSDLSGCTPTDCGINKSLAHSMAMQGNTYREILYYSAFAQAHLSSTV